MDPTGAHHLQKAKRQRDHKADETGKFPPFLTAPEIQLDLIFHGSKWKLQVVRTQMRYIQISKQVEMISSGSTEQYSGV